MGRIVLEGKGTRWWRRGGGVAVAGKGLCWGPTVCDLTVAPGQRWGGAKAGGCAERVPGCEGRERAPQGTGASLVDVLPNAANATAVKRLEQAMQSRHGGEQISSSCFTSSSFPPPPPRISLPCDNCRCVSSPCMPPSPQGLGLACAHMGPPTWVAGEDLGHPVQSGLPWSSQGRLRLVGRHAGRTHLSDACCWHSSSCHSPQNPFDLPTFPSSHCAPFFTLTTPCFLSHPSLSLALFVTCALRVSGRQAKISS